MKQQLPASPMAFPHEAEDTGRIVSGAYQRVCSAISKEGLSELCEQIGKNSLRQK